MCVCVCVCVCVRMSEGNRRWSEITLVYHLFPYERWLYVFFVINFVYMSSCTPLKPLTCFPDVELGCGLIVFFTQSQVSCSPSGGGSIDFATCSIDGAPPTPCELQ